MYLIWREKSRGVETVTIVETTASEGPSASMLSEGGYATRPKLYLVTHDGDVRERQGSRVTIWACCKGDARSSITTHTPETISVGDGSRRVVVAVCATTSTADYYCYNWEFNDLTSQLEGPYFTQVIAIRYLVRQFATVGVAVSASRKCSHYLGGGGRPTKSQ